MTKPNRIKLRVINMLSLVCRQFKEMKEAWVELMYPTMSDYEDKN